MKKLLFSASLLMLILASCNNQPTNNVPDQTHQHEDGSVHTDHDAVPHHQEEFTVETDSAQIDEHSHDDGHTHEH